MQKICCACRFIGNSITPETARRVEPPHAYYLVCDQGHIQCKDCVSRPDYDDKICHFEGSSHPKLPAKIECLQHNKDAVLLAKMTQHFLKVQATKTQKQQELQKNTIELGQERARLLLGSKERQQQLAANNITLEMLQDANLINNIGADIPNLRIEVLVLQQKIREQKRKTGYFFLFFDIFLSVIVLTAIPLQIITVIQFYSQDSDIVGILSIFSAILCIYFLSFLVVIVKQTCSWLHEAKKYVPAIILECTIMVPLLPILIAASTPLNTLQIINNKLYQRIFFIPNKTLFNWVLNHSILLLTTIVYWIALIKQGTVCQNPTQKAAFVFSFFEVVSLIYLNLQCNRNKQLRQKIYTALLP